MSSGQEVGEIFGEGTGPAAALLRSPTVIIASIALWGMNVCFFRLFGIDYVYVLTLDLRKDEEEKQSQKKLKSKLKTTSRNGVTHTQVPTSEEVSMVGNDESNGNMSPRSSEIEMTGISVLTSSTTEDSDEDLVNVSLLADSPSSKEAKAIVSTPTREINEVKLLGLAGILIMTLYMTQYFWIQVGRGTTIGAIFCFYALVTAGILMPIPSTNWIRYACKTVFVRAAALLAPKCSCVHGKPKPVPFIDVFFADGMCSMSKVSMNHMKYLFRQNILQLLFC